MPTVKLAGESPSKEAVRDYLAEELKGLGYQDVSIQNKMFVVANKDGTYAAIVKPKKSKISVGGNFPTNGKRMGFALSLWLLGFLIPLIWYMVARNKGMNDVAKEVAAVLEKKYGQAG